ncbi:MAG: hypothetical protein RLZZ461_756, partial [Planctomycetota bacterium]
EDWAPIADGARGTKDQVKEIVGFDADQFRRVMIVPQGRFREVLISSPQSREDLLRAIFGTDLYQRFEALVRRRELDKADGMRTAESELKGVLAGSEFEGRTLESGVLAEIEAEWKGATDLVKRAEKFRDKVAQRHQLAVEARAAAGEREKLFEAEQKAAERLRSSETALLDLKSDRETLRTADRAAPALKALEECERLLKDIEGRRTTLAEAEEVGQAIDAKLKVAAESAAAADKVWDGLQPKRDQLAVVQDRVRTLEEGAGDRKKKNDRLAAAQSTLKIATDNVNTAKCVVKSARDAESDADQAWRAAVEERSRHQAAELARTLESGCPCPVCGSTAHPEPARRDDDHELPNVDELAARHRKAVASRQTAEAQLNKAEEVRTKAVEDHATAKEAVDKLGTPVDLDEDRKTIRDLEKDLKDANDARDTAVKALEDLKEAKASHVTEVAGQIASLKTLTSEHGRAIAAFEQLLAEREFLDVADLQRAGRDEDWREDARKRIDAADTEHASATEIHRACVDALPEGGRPDLARLDRRLKRSEDRSSRVTKNHRALHAKADRLEELHGEVRMRAEALDSEQQAWKVLRALRDIVDPRQGRSVSFHEWVLGALLEEVLAEASILMERLSKGRYALVRSGAGIEDIADEGLPAAAKSNPLDIEVIDNHKGGRRAVRTLSGGESFLAALALSLSIARTTERHQGGRPLEMLFIDEGFGSLDPESLDLAMDALNGLRSEGRVVGVISHVEEMKRTIAAQIRLEKSDQSTNVAVVLG